MIMSEKLAHTFELLFLCMFESKKRERQMKFGQYSNANTYIHTQKNEKIFRGMEKNKKKWNPQKKKLATLASARI